MVDEVGLEPTMPEAEDLQSPGVTNFPTHPNISYGTPGSSTGRLRIRFAATLPCKMVLGMGIEPIFTT